MVPRWAEVIGVEREIGQTSAGIEVDSEAVEVHIVDSLPDSVQRANFETKNNKCNDSEIFLYLKFEKLLISVFFFVSVLRG